MYKTVFKACVLSRCNQTKCRNNRSRNPNI